MKALIVSIFSIVLLQTASASDWKRIQLTSANGTQVNLDYKISCQQYSLGPACNVYPLWVNVIGGNVRQDSRVRIVLKNLPMDNHGMYVNRETDVVDLNFAEGARFTAPVRMSTNAFRHFQEISVVVDGHWLRDPMSGSGNFQFSFLK